MDDRLVEGFHPYLRCRVDQLIWNKRKKKEPIIGSLDYQGAST
jgi:hypothetical protein